MQAYIVITREEVEISKNGNPFHSYRMTRSSWNRVLYLLRLYKAKMMVNCIRFVGMPETSGNSYDIRFHIEYETL